MHPTKTDQKKTENVKRLISSNKSESVMKNSQQIKV